MTWTPPAVVLASGSQRRSQLLSLVGIDHVVIVPDVDESPLPGEAAEALVSRLSALKAQAVLAHTQPGALVLAADTVVSLHGVIMGKPRDDVEASAMLRALRGQRHDVWTGMWLGSSGRTLASIATRTQIAIRQIDDDELAAYVATGEPLGKAGAYAIQGRGSTLVSDIAGDYYAVVGLSVAQLWAALRPRLGGAAD